MIWVCHEQNRDKSCSFTRVNAKLWGMGRDSRGFRGMCCSSLCQKYRHWQPTFGNFSVKEKTFGNSVFISGNLVHFPGCSPFSNWSCLDGLDLKWKHIKKMARPRSNLLPFYVTFNRPNRNSTPLAYLMPLKMVPPSYTLHCIHFLTGLRTIKLK